MFKRYRNVFVGLDVGSNGVAAAVCQFNRRDQWELLGLGYADAVGVSSGEVSQPEETAVAIRAAINEAEQAAQVSAGYVCAVINLPGFKIQSISATLHGQAVVDGPVPTWDILKQKLGPMIKSNHCGILQFTEVLYYIDGKIVANLPTNIDGAIKIEALALIAPTQPQQAWKQCFKYANVKVTRTIAGAWAAGEAVLSDAEKMLGVVCVDLGASLTSAAYFNRGKLKQITVLPIGSDHITADVAMGLRMDWSTAEKNKIKCGLQPDPKGEDRNLAIATRQSQEGPLDLNLYRIISARTEEILEYIKQFIDQLDLTNKPLGGVVLAGGGARLLGLRRLAQEYLALPARLGTNTVLTSFVPSQYDYRFLSAIGLVYWEQQYRRQQIQIRPPKRHFLKFIKKDLY